MMVVKVKVVTKNPKKLYRHPRRKYCKAKVKVNQERSQTLIQTMNHLPKLVELQLEEGHRSAVQ